MIVRSRWKRWGRLGVVLVVVAPVLAWLNACASDKPGAGGGGGGVNLQPPPDGCGTPNEGCACAEPGQVVPCGSVERTSPDGFVTCSMGHRTCAGTQWGACVGETDVVINTATLGAGGLGSRALGAGGVCGTVAGGPSNACDPYCNGYVDTSPGLPCTPGSVGDVDGGLGVCPNVTPDGGAGGAGTPGYGGKPPTLLTTSTGTSTCGPATNAQKAGCTVATQYVDCKQDFRCDPLTLTCQWNGPNNWFDVGAAGADLTVGAACTDGTDHIPVCNRGSVAVASGKVITIDLLNPADYTAWNTGACPTLLGPAACSLTLTAALDPGACVDVTGCAVNGDKYAVVNSEATVVAEAAGACANNAAYVNTTGAPGCAACTKCNTQIIGNVYDPSGFGQVNGNNLPLPGISVIEGAGTPPPMVDGVACDTCEGLEGKSIVKAVTDSNGAFQIDGVTPTTGTAKTTFTIQAGRWRRRIQVPIKACVANTAAPAVAPAVASFTKDDFRLPRNRTDSFDGKADIPKTAIVTGNQESMECLFVKMGVSDTEITSPTATTPAAGGGRIHIYKDKGLGVDPKTQTDVGLNDAVNAPTLPNGGLYVSQNSIDAYTASIFPCSGGKETSQKWTTKTESGYILEHVAKGGHALFNHHAADPLFYPFAIPPALVPRPSVQPTFSATSTWATSIGGTQATRFVVRLGTPPQQTFFDWLKNWGGMALYGVPYVWTTEGTVEAVVPLAGKTTEWLAGLEADLPADKKKPKWAWNATNSNSDFAASYSFEMGKDAALKPAVDAACGPTVAGVVPHGRVFFNGMHVSPLRANLSGKTTMVFPAECERTAALNETELAMEFHIFQLTACQLGGAPPPVPPAPLASTTFTRDFQGVCPVGTRVKWAPFYWQAVIPATTSIDFRAATSDVQASLPNVPPSPPAGAPTTAYVGKAAVTTAPATAWDCQGCPLTPTSVDSQLLADTIVPSASWLRVYMTFNPTATVSPALTAWRQVYDCVPAE